MNRRRWRSVAVGVLLGAWVGWVGWLLLSPPMIEEAMPKRHQLACQPIGRDFTEVSMLGAMSDEEEDFVDWYARNRVTGASDHLDWTRIRLLSEVTAACSEARTNRLASLVLVVGGGLALLATGAVVVVARRLPKVGADAP